MNMNVATLSAVLLAGVGFATSANAAEQVRGDITVRAARSGVDQTKDEVSTQRKISYSDISLTTASGVKVLENRIREAARSACNELAQKYPEPAASGDNNNCFNSAVEGAMSQANKVIDAAKR